MASNEIISNALEIHSLTVRYGNTIALHQVNASLKVGEMVALVGYNGSGKSSLMKAILNLTPFEGRITAWGKSVSEVLSKVAYVPQRAAVDWKYPATVKDIVSMGRYQPGLFTQRTSSEDAKAVDSAIVQAGLQDLQHRMIGELSGGQQQRVFIARAMARQADLFLMDEPFAGVDMKTEDAIFDILQSLQKQGKTLLIIHHQIDQVIKYFEQVWKLQEGKLETGSVEAILGQRNK
jgi:manganese/zinc/iron transport system ATP- binding protein